MHDSVAGRGTACYGRGMVPVDEALLRKLIRYLSLEDGKVHVYAYDSGSPFVVPTTEAQRERLLALGMRTEA